jgi:general secretion pathway protein D
MRFANLFKSLGLVLVLSQVLYAQDELIDSEVPPPNVDGLFDEELEPLDDSEVIRPQNNMPDFEQVPPSPTDISEPSPVERSFDRPSNGRSSFPSPRPSPSTAGRGLPSLPPGVKLPNEKEKVRMDFIQVDIEDIVKYFAERLQKRFLYDPTILSGKITIISPNEVTVREAWGAFLSAMEVRGYVIFPAGPFLKIEKAANARKAPVPVLVGESPNDDSYVTRILTLRYLNVNDIRQAVRNLLSRTAGDVIEHAPTNTLIISDYAYNIRRIVRILNILDVEGFQEQIAVISLKHSSAADVARKVNEFFPSGSSSGGRVRRTTGTTVAPTTGIAASGPAQQGVVQKVVADERTNSLIVLGSERGIEQVRRFIEQIDIPVEGGGGQIHVYPLQNVKAEDLSQTLAALASGASRNRNSMPLSTGGLSPQGTAPSLNQMPSGPTTASLLSGEVKVTADVPTNSLLIQASPRDFEVLKGIIRQLDVRRRQVFIESAILEALVRRGSEFGTQAAGPFARTGVLGQDPTSANGNESIDSAGIFSLGSLASSFDSLLTNPTALTGLALGFRSGGTYDVKIRDADGEKTIKLPLLSAVIRLAANSRDLNVVSTPHILATANEEASISIGEEIPQETSNTQEGAVISRSFTRVRVATELTITPQINAGDYVSLKIKQKVNNRGTEPLGNQINTINREANTTAIVKDQQTIVIGGLMEDRKTTSVEKVPFLGDIPLLGWLFKSRRVSSEKVNLLLFLTPHIIKDTADMNDQFFRKLKERQEFLKDLGVSENKGVPSSGLSPEQLQMLDQEYVKSLKKQELVPLTPIPPAAEPSWSPEVKNPADAGPSLKMVEPKAPESTLSPTAPAAPEAPGTLPPLEDTPPETTTPADPKKAT